MLECGTASTSPQSDQVDWTMPRNFVAPFNLERPAMSDMQLARQLQKAAPDFRWTYFASSAFVEHEPLAARASRAS